MPLMMDITTMRVVVAITTPRRVRKERSLCARKASRAIQKASRVVPHNPAPALDRAGSACGGEAIWPMDAIENSKFEIRKSKFENRNLQLEIHRASFEFRVSSFDHSTASPCSVLRAQGFNGIEFGRLAGRVNSKKEAYRGGERQSHEDGLQGYRRGPEMVDDGTDNESQEDPDGAARARHHDRLNHKLRQNIAPTRAQGFANTNFVGSFRDAGQHDVHNDDAAHHHEHGHNSNGCRKDAAHKPVPQGHDGLGSVDTKIIVLVVRDVTAGAQQGASFIFQLQHLLRII